MGGLDARGAVLVGESAVSLWASTGAVAGFEESEVSGRYEQLAREQTGNLMPGRSSADGEQAKFVVRLRRDDSVVECIVKFSPPRGTPYGERWHELLWTEQLAAQVLSDAGFDVPHSRIVETPTRTFLESERLDRVGRSGRRHMLPLAVAHQAFVPGGLQHWSGTVGSLIRQKRLDSNAQETVDVIRCFGHLIGNTDMHGGNLSFFVDTPEALWLGAFRLAPIYDMLPMRYAPTARGMSDYAWFDADALLHGIPGPVRQKANALALQFWRQVAEHASLGRELRQAARVAVVALGPQLIRKPGSGAGEIVSIASDFDATPPDFDGYL